MVDGILDLVVMILVLSIVLLVAFGLILPLVNDEKYAGNEMLVDKTMIGTVQSGESLPMETGMSAEEVVLMTQVQDATMPLPRAFTIGTEMLKIESTYKLVIRQTGIEVWGKLPDKHGKYTVGYDFQGTPLEPWVCNYKIKQVK